MDHAVRGVVLVRVFVGVLLVRVYVFIRDFFFYNSSWLLHLLLFCVLRRLFPRRQLALHVHLLGLDLRNLSEDFLHLLFGIFSRGVSLLCRRDRDRG